MGEGDFAVVPSSLIDNGNASVFLPSCALCACQPRLSIHPLNDTLTLVADATRWDDSYSCHELEPMLVECLKCGDESLHAAQFGNRLYIAVHKDNTLAFVNRFTVRCDEDTLYHLLAVCKAMSLTPQHTTLHTQGVNKDFIKKYFARCV